MSSTGSSADTDTDSAVTVTISPPVSVDVSFENLEGSEGLGRPFLYELSLSSVTACPDVGTWLGSSVTVAYSKTKDTKGYVNGILTRAVYAGLVGGAYRYRVELRPWIWLLTRKQDCKIFQNQTAYDIITSVFSDNGFSGSFSDSRQNSAGSTVLEYCVQYNETSFDFVTRLMELWGLYYYIKHADGSHTLVICDDPGSHESIHKGSETSIPFAFKQTDYRQTVDHVWEWTSELRLHSGAYTLTDYNFTTPAADLTGKSTTSDTTQHDYGTYEVFTYPGPNDTAAVGQTLATVRMRDLTMRGHVFRGTTNSRKIYTGCKFTLSNAADDALNKEYIVIESSHALKAAEGRTGNTGDIVDAMRTTFIAILGTTNFQLALLTPRPIIRGPQTAKVVGTSGEEITTDQYGRVKCKFFWDRSATQDENSSCWIRVAQLWAGLGWGAMYVPRIGQEVIVEYLEGNPDRPIITGRVYNATQTVPYALPDNATQSTIKSNSSKGGGGYNEIRFEDKAGSEEVYFQAQKDYNKVVLNNETVKIKQDTTTTVEQGNHTIDVSAGTSAITAAKSITLTVGSNSITIDTNGITLAGGKISSTAQTTATFKGASVTVQGSTDGTVDGGGALTVKGGMVKIN